VRRVVRRSQRLQQARWSVVLSLCVSFLGIPSMHELTGFFLRFHEQTINRRSYTRIDLIGKGGSSRVYRVLAQPKAVGLSFIRCVCLIQR